MFGSDSQEGVPVCAYSHGLELRSEMQGHSQAKQHNSLLYQNARPFKTVPVETSSFLCCLTSNLVWFTYLNRNSWLSYLHLFYVQLSAWCILMWCVFPFSLQLNNWFIFCFDFSVPSFTFTPTGIYLHLPSSTPLFVGHVSYSCGSVFISFSWKLGDRA